MSLTALLIKRNLILIRLAYVLSYLYLRRIARKLLGNNDVKIIVLSVMCVTNVFCPLARANDNRADLIIFSCDRPLQLYALLESIHTYVLIRFYCRDLSSFSIILLLLHMIK